MTDKNDIQFSEMFCSIQGEAYRTGYPAIWLRFFVCNLTCGGFLQDEPTDPSTWDKQYEQIPVENVEKLEDLPVITKGCDSAYSWAKRFKHLQHNEQAAKIADDLDAMLPRAGVWVSPQYSFDMIFTGGEPLLKKAQQGVASIVDVWTERLRSVGDGKELPCPTLITFETNGTQTLFPFLVEAFKRYDDMLRSVGHKLTILFNFSPKLHTVSGEPNNKAIKPEKVFKNFEILDDAQVSYEYVLKFVMQNEQRCWDEVEMVIDRFNEYSGIENRSVVWIMPVSATMQDQATYGRPVADEAIRRGYKVAARVQTLLWDNTMGV